MGKTTLAVDIIITRILHRVRRCFAACPTFYDQPALQRLRDVPGAFPPEHVFTHVDDSVFDDILNRLHERPAPTLLFVDDSAAESSTNKGGKGAFSRLCVLAPHVHLYIVGVFQYITQCSPAFRYNTEGLISFIPTKEAEVKLLKEEFNPHPARAGFGDWVLKALDQCWSHERYAFIWREGFNGKMHFYQGFNREIVIPEPETQKSTRDLTNEAELPQEDLDSDSEL